MYIHLYFKLKGAQNKLFQSSMISNVLFFFINSLSWQKMVKNHVSHAKVQANMTWVTTMCTFSPWWAPLTYLCDYLENYHTALYISVYFQLPLIILNPTRCDKPMFCLIVLQIASHLAIRTSPWRSSWILRECPCFEMSTWSQIFIWGP